MYRFVDPGAFHHGPGVLGWLIFAALVGLIVIGVALVIHRWRPGTGWFRSAPASTGDTALAEIRRRYALGEVSREEYFEKLGDLGKTDHRGGTATSPS